MLRLDQGEELFSSLSSFAEQTGIRAATFTVIGTAKEVTLSWYDIREKKYEDTTITDELEVLGVIGNIGVMEGKSAIHAHGLISDRALAVKGGHIKRLVVHATCEVSLVIASGTFERAYDPSSGLNLLS